MERNLGENNGEWSDSSSEEDSSSDDDQQTISVDQLVDGVTGRRILGLARQSYLNILRQGIQRSRSPSSQDNVEEIPRNETIETEKAVRLRRQFRSNLFPPRYSKNCSTVSNVRNGVCNSHEAKLGRFQIMSEMVPNYFVHRIKFKRRVFSGVFTPNGKYFVTSSQDFVIHVYDGNRISAPVVKKLHIPDCGWAILDVAISPDSRKGAASSWGSKIHLFNINSEKSDNEVKSTLINDPSHEGIEGCAIFSLKFNHDGKKLLGGSKYGCLIEFDLEAGQNIIHSSDWMYREDQNAVCYSKQNYYHVFTGGDNGMVTCWDSRLFGSRESPVGHLAGHSEGITYIDTADDGYTILTNCKDQTIKLWDIRKFTSEDSAKQFERDAVNNGNDWDYRYNFLPSKYADSKIVVQKGDTSIMTFAGHSVLQTLVRAKFSPSYTRNRYIYAGDSRGGYCVWDIHSGDLILQNNDIHSKNVRDVDWHPHQPLLATSSWDETITFWKPQQISMPSDYKISSSDQGFSNP